MSDLFDRLGPPMWDVVAFGTLIYEREKGGKVAQIWQYGGEINGDKYAMVWDKKTGDNLLFTNYKNIKKEQEVEGQSR